MKLSVFPGLWIDENGAMKLFHLAVSNYTEAEILKKFLSIFDKAPSDLGELERFTI